MATRKLLTPHILTLTPRKKSDVAAEIRAHQSWDPYEIANKQDLLNSLIFLKLNMGLLDPMDRFIEKVYARLSPIAEKMPHEAFPRTHEEILRAEHYVRDPDPFGRCYVNVTMHTMQAKAWAAVEASQAVFGELDTDGSLWIGAKRIEELEIAKLLLPFLSENGLI